MAEFPAPAEGIVLTHFIVASDVGRSRHFYAGVLGGEVLRDGELFMTIRSSAGREAGRARAPSAGGPCAAARQV
jgi:hypothetical protein